jgi:chaperone BCS1
MKRGIPYKRGYILYGPPGSGKTCISKIVANKYNIPIFYLDLTTISKNESLIDLVDEISVYACGKKYILLMEDVERSGFFAKDEKTETKLTMDCLLNVLDGVVEPHNRITIMTVNDKSKIVGHEALIRPGRIDKIIEIGYCDSTQIENMFHLFFPNSKIKQTSYKLKNNITPAIVMKFLQESEQPQQFFAMLKNH